MEEKMAARVAASKVAMMAAPKVDSVDASRAVLLVAWTGE